MSSKSRPSSGKQKRPTRAFAEGQKRRLTGRFAAQFVKNPTAVGTLFRSGPFLAKRITEQALRFEPRVVVEVGCGDGAITRALAAGVARSGGKLFAVDINPDLVRANATNGQTGMVGIADAGALPVRQADVVVCGLPLALFSKEKSRAIVHEFRKVAPHFVSFQYTTTRYKIIREAYPSAKVVSYVLANMPPACVIAA